MSDNMDSDLLSVVLVKDEKYVVIKKKILLN